MAKKTSKSQSPLFPKKKRGRPPGSTNVPKQPREKKRREDLPENQVTKQCVDWLNAKGWNVVRQQSGLFTRPGGQARIRIGEPGTTDWRMERRIMPGGHRIDARKVATICQLAYIELKAPGKAPSDEQLLFMERQRANGFPAMWFDSLKDLKKWYAKLCFDIMAGESKPAPPAEVPEEKHAKDGSEDDADKPVDQPIAES